jgi:putative phosphoribosyl transferase
MSHFPDRAAAGRELAQRLQPYANREDALVLGLARGGMPVAFEVADALQLELDVFLVRKLGVPGHEELAMGAIASGGVRVMNQEVLDRAGISAREVETVAAREQSELDRRERAYRDDRPPAAVADRTAVLVDDGLATGSSMRAAVTALRERDAAAIVVAVPIAPPQVCAELEREADAVVCAHTPEPFGAVGLWYDDFSQTSDDDVRAIVARARHGMDLEGDSPQARRGHRT